MPSQLNQNTSELQAILDDVNSIPNGGVSGAMPVLLWTNPLPTASFSAQSIAVDGADYAHYIVVAKDTSSSSSVIKVVVDKNVASYQTICPTTSRYRRVTAATDTGITFGSGYNNTGNTYDNYVVPTQIWGVKYTLSDDEVSGIGGSKLLWTNPSPLDNFAAQSVTVNGANYVQYIVEATINNDGCNQKVIFDKYVSSASLYGIPYIRQLMSITDLEITFDDTLRTGTSNPSVSNSYIIPIRIFGVKYAI